MTQTSAPARAIFRDPAHEAVFQATGFLIAPIFDADQIAALEHGWRTLRTPIHDLPFSASVMTEDIGYRDAVDGLLRAAFAPAIAALLDDYRFVLGNFVTKTPFSDVAMPIHQDPMFVDETQFEAINFWVPLRAVAPETGCLRIVPGSHRLNRGPRGTDRRFPYPELEPLIESAFLYDLAMPAGSACIMNLRLMHASRPNMIAAPRICASALTAPRECPMCYQYQHNCGPVDVYEVDDLFLQHQVYGAKPQRGERTQRVRARFDPITPGALAAAHDLAAPHLASVVIG